MSSIGSQVCLQTCTDAFNEKLSERRLRVIIQHHFVNKTFICRVKGLMTILSRTKYFFSLYINTLSSCHKNTAFSYMNEYAVIHMYPNILCRLIRHIRHTGGVCSKNESTKGTLKS